MEVYVLIKTLSLKNFKSFINTNDIELAPLTVLSGQNSSGKSSLVQAILVLKQTLESPFSDEPIILNGAYVTLGEFGDIINNYAKEGESIQFEVKLKNLIDSELLNYDDSNIQLSLFDNEDIDEVNISIDIDKPDPKEERGNIPQLLKAQIAGIANGHKFKLVINANKCLTDKLAEQFIIENNLHISEPYMLFEVDRPHILNPRPEAVKVNKFLPETILVSVNKHLLRAKSDFLLEFSQFLSKRTGIRINIDGFKRPSDNILRIMANKLVRHKKTSDISVHEKVDPNVINEILHLLENILSDSPEWPAQDTQSYLQAILINLNELDLAEAKSFIQEWTPRINNVKSSKKTIARKSARFLRFFNNDTNLYQINEFIKESFNRIYYLGPLREEPRVFYRRSGSADPMYVGSKGENVAFVLKYYSNRKILTVLPPKDGMEWNPLSRKVEQCPLGDAVMQWLKYIGVANEIKVEEMGKLGLTIRANIFGDKDSDLTNVGVGVSQVLPLIVLGLASPVGSVLILEQPELHLHPYVQSKLGDFFAALTRLKKQVIAETHSEHLILRLRYHIAKKNLDIKDDVSIYFIQRNSVEKKAEVLKVDIDKFGSIDNWPKGFFDETNKLLDDILNAALDRDDIF